MQCAGWHSDILVRAFASQQEGSSVGFLQVLKHPLTVDKHVRISRLISFSKFPMSVCTLTFPDDAGIGFSDLNICLYNICVLLYVIRD